ncbi:MAG: tetratricopeptide repeat protein [Spirochaetales bacterium]|nr:tetratricopeptide repeat protein [Spirochaetales bacterium]
MIFVIIALIVIALIVLVIVVARSGIFGSDKGIKDGMRYESQGRYHDALAAYDKVMQRSNVTPELRWKIANICLKLNLISRAQKELNILASTKNYPSGVSAAQIKATLAAASIATGNEREAFYELAEVLRMNNRIPTAYRDMGYIYCHQAQTKKGIAYLEKYIGFVPNDQEALYTLGIAYLDAGNANTALSYLERALRVKTPETADIEYYIGLIYLGSKKYGPAQQHLSHALNKKASKEIITDAYRMLALCCKEKGLIDEAIINYGKAIEASKNNARDPSNKASMYNQAVLYVHKNNLKKAEENFTQLHMLDPGYKDTRIALEAVRNRIANKPTAYIFKFIESSIINSVLMKGLLYSRSRFDIEAFEIEVQKQLDMKSPANTGNGGGEAKKSASASHLSVADINNMNVTSFKEIAKKIIMATGYAIQSDIRFQGDHDYMNGNAVNYVVKPTDGSKGGNKEFSIRRFSAEVDQMDVGTFIDWLEEKGIHNGIYVVTNSFGKSAVSLIQKTPNVKFIDQNGLSKILMHIK